MDRKKRIKKRIFLIIISILLIYITASLIWSNNILTYSSYNIESSKIKNNIRFVMVSDSEGKVFGENNSRLIEKVKGADPEFVVILGDMVNRNNGDYQSAVNLCKNLAKSYPVFYAIGNHENTVYNNNTNYTNEFVSAIKNTGTKILVNELVNYKTKGGDVLAIAGLKQFPFFEYDAPDYNNEENHLFQQFLAQEDDSHLSVLLCHCPETYIWGLENYNIDLMLCGHTHGGVVRLPFAGGLYAPEQGWFPQYDKGYYTNGNASMLITSGLSVSSVFPRFNNPPDVAIVNLTAK